MDFYIPLHLVRFIRWTPSLTLPDLWNWYELNSHHQIEGQTGKVASFKEILQQSNAVAAELRSAGITAGDYVIICCEKSILAYSIVFGAIFTGATVVLPPIPRKFKRKSSLE